MRIPMLIGLGIALASVGTFGTSQENWRLQRDQENIRIYTRPSADSRVTWIRTVTTLDDTPINAAVALLQDTPAMEQWTARCEDAYVYRKLKDDTTLTYTRTDFPLLYADRWMLSRSSWRRGTESGELVFTSEATDRAFEPEQDGVRITDSRIEWHLIPLDDGELQVSYTGYADPGIDLPQWLVENLAIDAPFESMVNFREMLNEPGYRDSELDLTIPGHYGEK